VWLTLCRVRSGQFRRYPMGRRIAAVDPSVTQSRVGTHWSGAQYLRDALFKGRNIQELSVGDTSVGDTSTLPLDKIQPSWGCDLAEFVDVIFSWAWMIYLPKLWMISSRINKYDLAEMWMRESREKIWSSLNLRSSRVWIRSCRFRGWNICTSWGWDPAKSVDDMKPSCRWNFAKFVTDI
jgi:hypothetical protein